MPKLTIQLPGLSLRSYEVVVGPGVLVELGAAVARVLPGSSGGRRAFLIHDDALPASTVASAGASLAGAGFNVTAASAHATEEDKSYHSFARLMALIAETKHERRDPVIALGGGIVGDLAGFVAASYRRGVPIVQCPTTLLSMVDASVGGKAGINLNVHGHLKKNLVGAFWQPMVVMADTDTLASLSDRHLRAGLAECLKHGMIAGETDAGLLAWTLDHLDAVMERDSAVLAELIERNVRVKASFVGDDEREEKSSAEGGRAMLNLGHTFAHAIETVPGLSPTGDAADAPLHHGEAVALGLVAAAYTASALHRIPWADAERIRRSVESAGLPTSVIGLPGEEAMLEQMMHDKKVSDGRLRLVLPAGLTRASIVEDPPYEAVRVGITAIRG